MSEKLSLPRQLLYQALCLFITLTVLFPILWIVGMSLDSRNIARPRELFPHSISLQAYQRVLNLPTTNPVTFAELTRNSLFLAGGVALASLLIGVSAAYIFARFDFRGRRALMMAVVTVLMLPSIATIAPLFVMLNRIQVSAGPLTFNLRNSLWGVGLAMTSSALPFSIWNLKGYLDTIPRELEEAASVDGASRLRTFWHVILPLSTPVIAVTAFFGFIAGWTEFYFSWQFLTQPSSFTLSMALNGMVGQYAGDTRWSEFAAFSILVALPVSVVYLFLQRYIVSGLTIGGVKG